MICREALEVLLSADLSDLRGVGDSEVARHVRECTRCGAVAARLTAETQRVASVMAATRPALRSPRRFEHPLGALTGTLVVAAAVLMVAVIRGPLARHPVSSGSPPPPRVTAAEPAQAPVASPARPASQDPPLAPLHARRFDGRITAPLRYRPVPLRAHEATTTEATVSVEPSRGQRAAVIRTANPSVTVVWIY